MQPANSATSVEKQAPPPQEDDVGRSRERRNRAPATQLPPSHEGENATTIYIHNEPHSVAIVRSVYLRLSGSSFERRRLGSPIPFGGGHERNSAQTRKACRSHTTAINSYTKTSFISALEKTTGNTSSVARVRRKISHPRRMWTVNWSSV